jgi:hypothetical protein
LPDLLWFHFFDFTTINCLQSKVISLASNPTLEGQIPVFMPSYDRVAQLYPQAPGSLFVVFYDSQGYSGDILTCFHIEKEAYISNINARK